METTRQIACEMARLAYPPITLSNDTIDKLASILVRIELKKGERYLRENDVCRYIGYVQRGMIRQFYYKNDKDLTEHFASENTIFFCIESFLRQQPTTLLAEAVQHSVVYGVPYDEIHELAKTNYEMELIYRGWIEDSLILSLHKIDSFRFETAHERYKRLLKERPEVIRHAPLSQIASYLLMTPETLSRVRATIQS